MDLFVLYLTVSLLSLFALFILFYSRRIALTGATAGVTYSITADHEQTVEALEQQKPSGGAEISNPSYTTEPSTDPTSLDQEYLAKGFEKINKLFLEQGSDSEINQLALSQICKQINCFQAALYTSDDQKEILRLDAGYGITKKADREVVQHGSGQVGQALLDNESIIIRNIPKGYIKITSGLGASEPTWIGIFPLSFKGKAYGVLEMCFLHPESEAVKGYLEKISEVFGAHLFNQNVIVEQTQLEQLQQEKLKSEAILEGCADGFIGFNREGIIDFCNQSAADLIRRPKEGILGRSIGDLLDINIEEKAESAYELIHHGLQRTILHEKTEIQINDAEGEEVTVLVTANSIPFGDDFLFTLFIQKISVDLF